MKALFIAAISLIAVIIADYFLFSGIKFLPNLYAAYLLAATIYLVLCFFVLKNIKAKSLKSVFAFVIMLILPVFLAASFFYNLNLLNQADEFVGNYMPFIYVIMDTVAGYFAK
jgi:ABC-type multidrug transport system permease subunit